jgi:glycine amidinotransferase
MQLYRRLALYRNSLQLAIYKLPHGSGQPINQVITKICQIDHHAMPSSILPSVNADDEWSQLRSVIVGCAAKSCFPYEPSHMIKATMPELHQQKFQPDSPFPEGVLQKAAAELDQLARVLQEEGIKVYRPSHVDWRKVGGYTAAMVRDGLMTVNNTIIEAPFAWHCRKREIDLAYGDLLADLAANPHTTVVRAPKVDGPDTIYDNVGQHEHVVDDGAHEWAINNTRPAFDCADFMRFGKVLIGQYSNVTNKKGVDYLRANIPEGYTVEMLEGTRASPST